MTIRQHLAKPTAAGLLRLESQRRPVGRPAYAYYLTPHPPDRFPKSDERIVGLPD